MSLIRECASFGPSIFFSNPTASVMIKPTFGYDLRSNTLMIQGVAFEPRLEDIGTPAQRSRLVRQVHDLYVDKAVTYWPTTQTEITGDGKLSITEAMANLIGVTFDDKQNHDQRSTPLRSGPEFNEITKAAHYNSHPSGVEAKHLLRLMPFNLGTAMKYVLRAGLKGDAKLKDLKKAEFYVLDELENRTAEEISPRNYRIGTDLVEKIVNHRVLIHETEDGRGNKYAPQDTLQNEAIKAVWHAAVDLDDLPGVTGALSSVRAMIAEAESLADTSTPTESPTEHAS